jgi:hypothetical protein
MHTFARNKNRQTAPPTSVKHNIDMVAYTLTYTFAYTQVVPHITNAIGDWIEKVASRYVYVRTCICIHMHT